MFDRRSFLGKISGLLVVPFLPKKNKSTRGYSEIHYERNYELSEDYNVLIVHRGSFAWFGGIDELENARKSLIPPLQSDFKRTCIDFRIKPVSDSSVSVVTWKVTDKENPIVLLGI